MAGTQATSAAGVTLIIHCLQQAVAYLSQVPDKGTHQAQILKECINEIPQVENKLQQYVNSRASGIN